MRSAPTALGRALAGVSGMALLATALLAGANWWVARSAKPFVHGAIAEVPPRDVALVLGVGAMNHRMTPNLTGRLRAALELYRAHKVRAILVSGVAGGPDQGDETQTSRQWLEIEGVAAGDILIDGGGDRTLDSMQRAAHVLRVESATICTQDSHLPRAIFLARAAGIDAVGFVAATTTPANRHELGRELLKSALAFVETYVLHRAVGGADAATVATVAAAPQLAARGVLSPRP